MAFRNPNSAFGRYHYDGAREISRERPRGTTTDGRFAMHSVIGIEMTDLR
jgi:hypothetical protein